MNGGGDWWGPLGCWLLGLLGRRGIPRQNLVSDDISYPGEIEFQLRILVACDGHDLNGATIVGHHQFVGVNSAGSLNQPVRVHLLGLRRSEERRVGEEG